MLTESLQPLPLVTMYLIVAVPADTPVTKPLAFIVATPGVLDTQVPLAVALLNCVVLVAQTVVVPVVAAITGNAFTVTLISWTGRQVEPASGFIIA